MRLLNYVTAIIVGVSIGIWWRVGNQPSIIAVLATWVFLTLLNQFDTR
jgi:hypothetical protein